MSRQPLLVIPDSPTNRLKVQLTTLARCLTDDFEWNATRWRIRFQSWARKPQEVDPLMRLLDVFPEDHPDYQEPTQLPQKEAKLKWL